MCFLEALWILSNQLISHISYILKKIGPFKKTYPSMFHQIIKHYTRINQKSKYTVSYIICVTYFYEVHINR